MDGILKSIWASDLTKKKSLSQINDLVSENNEVYNDWNTELISQKLDA